MNFAMTGHKGLIGSFLLKKLIEREGIFGKLAIEKFCSQTIMKLKKEQMLKSMFFALKQIHLYLKIRIL